MVRSCPHNRRRQPPPARRRRPQSRRVTWHSTKYACAHDDQWATTAMFGRLVAAQHGIDTTPADVLIISRPDLVSRGC